MVHFVFGVVVMTRFLRRAIWRGQFLGECNADISGEFSMDDAGDGIDVDDFVGGIWLSLARNGILSVQLLLPCGVCVDIDSECIDNESEVIGVTFDSAKKPLRIKGRWAVS